MARTPWVVMLNSDTIPRAGWLEELYEVRDLCELARDTSVHARGVGLVGSVMSHEEPRRFQIAVDKDYVTAHCWLASMQALAEISNMHGTPGIYLDETSATTVHIHSDVYACWDMNKLGWATVKSFKSHVDHHGGKAWGHQVGRVSGVTLNDVAYHYSGAR